MAINLSQAFNRTAPAPIDGSLVLSKAEMLAVNDNLMPSRYFTICTDDGQIYTYDKSATPNAQTGKFSPYSGGLDYSTDEKVVGTWIDGKTLYQRTYSIALPDTANTEKKVAHGVSNLNAIVAHEACVLSPNNKTITCLPWISTAGVILASIVRFDTEYIGLVSNSDRSAYTAVITIRYTKTTD